MPLMARRVLILSRRKEKNMSEKINRDKGGRKRKVVTGTVQRIKRGAKAVGSGRVGEGSVGLGEMIKDAFRAFKK